MPEKELDKEKMDNPDVAPDTPEAPETPEEPAGDAGKKTGRLDVEAKIYEAIKDMSPEDAQKFIQLLLEAPSSDIDEAIAWALEQMGGESKSEGAEELPPRGTGLENGNAGPRRGGKPRTDEERAERHAEKTEEKEEEETDSHCDEGLTEKEKRIKYASINARENQSMDDLPDGLTPEKVSLFEEMDQLGKKPDPKTPDYNLWLLWQDWKTKSRPESPNVNQTTKQMSNWGANKDEMADDLSRPPEEKTRDFETNLEDTMSDNRTARTVRRIVNDNYRAEQDRIASNYVLPIENPSRIESFTEDEFEKLIQPFKDDLGVERISTLTHDDVIRMILMAEHDPKQFARELAKIYPSKILGKEVDKLDSFTDVVDITDSFDDVLAPYVNTDSFAEAKKILKEEVQANSEAWQFFKEAVPSAQGKTGKDLVKEFLSYYLD